MHAIISLKLHAHFSYMAVLLQCYYQTGNLESCLTGWPCNGLSTHNKSIVITCKWTNQLLLLCYNIGNIGMTDWL